MFGMSNFKSSTSQSRFNSLESLVRTAMVNGELAPGVAMQVNRYRAGKLTCEERRLLSILDDAIADGCVACVELPTVRTRRQVAYSLG